MTPRPETGCKLSIPRGSERGKATAGRGLGEQTERPPEGGLSDPETPASALPTPARFRPQGPPMFDSPEITS
jgi:hypothetical protein